jgi:RHS repeat-associated protein
VDELFGFAGREWDADVGLSNNRARWYDPALGRFLSEDPSGFADGANLYRYSGNDPVNFVDPTGLFQAGNPLNNLFGGSKSVSPALNPYAGLSGSKPFANLSTPVFDVSSVASSFLGPQFDLSNTVLKTRDLPS